MQLNRFAFEVIEPTERRKKPVPHVDHMPRGSFGNPFDLSELIKNDTGTLVSTEGWLKSQKRRNRLREQGDEMRALLAESGIETECQNSTDIVFEGAITGCEYRQTQLRNINICPDIADRNRRQQQLSFFKFAESRPFLRYLVVTAGERIEPFADEDDIADRRRDLLRRISKLAAYARERFGIQIYLAALECPRDPDDGSYHLHANVIYDGPKLSEDEWASWLRSMRRRLRFHAEDNGRLKNLHEVIKYITKPESLVGLGGDEARWLYEQWYRGRVVVPYGRYRDYLADIKRRRLKIVQRADGELIFMKKDKAVRRTLEQRLSDLAEQLGHDVTREELAEAEAAERVGEMENVILTITQPTTMFGPFREPVIVHLGLNHRPKGSKSKRRYEDYLCARTMALLAWEENTDMTPNEARRIAEQLKAGENVVPLKLKRAERERSDYRVHNNTLIVHFPTRPWAGSEVDPPPDDPAELGGDA